MEKEKHWSLMEPWNTSLVVRKKDKRIEPRNYLFASELGKPFIEVYWAMNGIEPTNLASDIARRKMEAGNFYEAIVVWVLRRVGLLKETQTKVRLTDKEKCLNVHGRLDIVAGHDGNWDETYKELDSLFLKLDGSLDVQRELVEMFLNEEGIEIDEEKYKIFRMGVEYGKIKDLDFPFINVVKTISYTTVDYLKSKYPHGLEDKIYEVKSINSLAFWRNNEPISSPYAHHIRQLSFYQMYHTVKKGSFLYIDRDTMSVSELPNFITEEIENEIHSWIEKMTYYYLNKIEPPKPELVIYDNVRKRYTFNWKVDRSQYKNLLLDGMDEIAINIEVKKMNKEMRQNNLIKSAMNGEDVRGVKKYILAINLLNEKNTDEEIIKKSKITVRELAKIKDSVNKKQLNLI